MQGDQSPDNVKFPGG